MHQPSRQLKDILPPSLQIATAVQQTLPRPLALGLSWVPLLFSRSVLTFWSMAMMTPFALLGMFHDVALWNTSDRTVSTASCLVYPVNPVFFSFCLFSSFSYSLVHFIILFWRMLLAVISFFGFLVWFPIFAGHIPLLKNITVSAQMSVFFFLRQSLWDHSDFCLRICNSSVYFCAFRCCIGMLVDRLLHLCVFLMWFQMMSWWFCSTAQTSL